MFFRRIARFLRDKAPMIIVIIVGGFSLNWLAHRVTVSTAPANAGMIVNTEMIYILVPQAYVDIAENPMDSDEVRTPDGLHRVLERRGLQKSWYGMVAYVRQKNDEARISAWYSRPFNPESAWRFGDHHTVFAYLAGNPPAGEQTDFSGTMLVVIPRHLENAHPPDVIAELTGATGDAGPPRPQ